MRFSFKTRGGIISVVSACTVYTKGKVKMGRFMSSAYFLILFKFEDKKKERWLYIMTEISFDAGGERFSIKRKNPHFFENFI